MKAFKKSDNSLKVICLTPVRNESWIIKPFLAASKMWADHVIVADQGSTDGTLELLQSTRDVETIINAAKTYDERHRQRLLVDKAREFQERRTSGRSGLGKAAARDVSCAPTQGRNGSRVIPSEPKRACSHQPCTQ